MAKTRFVISRVINEASPEGNDYLLDDSPEALADNGYHHWTESPALAKWYDTEEEAQADLQRWIKSYPVCRIVPFDALEAMLPPIERELAALRAVQHELRRMMRDRRAYH
jgi:hypothetical protein